MERTATAHWQGNFKEGKGILTTQSGILNNTKYSFKTRFEVGENGTNPEELLAAAHSGCFTMSVAAMLTQKGLNPTSLETKATVTLEGLTITCIHLAITGVVAGITPDEFSALTKDAANSCVLSKALSVPITSEARVVA